MTTTIALETSKGDLTLKHVTRHCIARDFIINKFL